MDDQEGVRNASDGAQSEPRSLRERLRARGAKPHSRMSDVSRYMLEHYDEMRALVAVERFAWADIAALLADEERLTGEDGSPVTPAAAKLAFSRVGKLRRTDTPSAARPSPFAGIGAAAAKPQASAGSMTPASAPEPPSAVRSQERDAPPALASEPSPIDVRPASLRQARPPAPQKNPSRTTPSLLSDDELQRRMDELESRQGGPRIPSPKVL